MAAKLLWEPSAGTVERSQLTAYMRAQGFDGYRELWEWSVRDLEGFWASVWEWFAVVR